MIKNFQLVLLACFLLFIVCGLSVSAENNTCAQVFSSNCAECHEIDRGCELLGQPQKEWEELFDFMEGMGADIPDDEKTILLDCLNRQDEGIKTECAGG